MIRNTQEVLTIIENKARVRTCRNKPQVSSGGGTSTQIHAITALTKLVKALEYHFASMRETYDQNQETAVQLMQNQIGQMADFPKKTIRIEDSYVEINTLLSHFNNSSPDYETFCFDIEEKSSGSTTSHFDYSLPDYDAFYFDDDHIKG
ncbi:hypothetical protein Tco_1028728 [Tanacetum coccineum]|uniref:Uncharacterized protein n=1 Tax=Tanacetum coccineum TaxID=301880 RepID=A0ABQ5G3L1_9ASTR